MNNNITVVRGDDHTLTFTLKDENAAVVDLTGATVFFTVKKATIVESSTDDTNASISKTLAASDPTNGIALVYLTNSDTNLDPTVSYLYDFQVKFSDGKIRSVVSGAFIVTADVTRRTS
jgi:hypothetical protein